MQLAAV